MTFKEIFNKVYRIDLEAQVEAILDADDSDSEGANTTESTPLRKLGNLSDSNQPKRFSGEKPS